jgi:hypothetical protein
VKTAGLVILDPLNRENNLGRTTFNFEDIRAAFSFAYDSIREKVGGWSGPRVLGDVFQ